MVTDTEAREIIRRFAPLRGFPDAPNVDPGKARLTALRQALQKWCRNADHARRVAERVVEESTFMPTEAELKDVAERVPWSTERRETCDRCRATWGWVIVTDGLHSGARRCDHQVHAEARP